MSRSPKIKSSDIRCTAPTQYYDCINCGHVGDFQVMRTHKLECSACGYDDILPISMTVFNRAPKWKKGSSYCNVKYMAFQGNEPAWLDPHKSVIEQLDPATVRLVLEDGGTGPAVESGSQLELGVDHA